MKNEKGFTLIELVIFVVFAGIILGLFFGFNRQEEISEIRSIIVQTENYNFAVRSFREKYGELPGDIASTQVLNLSESNTDGNEDGILEDVNGSVNGASGEIVNFWYHLSNSGFLKDKFDGKSGDNAKVGSTFPQLFKTKRIGITVFGLYGKNYYQIGVSGVDENNIKTTDFALNPKVAFGIDKKIDDGFATKGNIIALNGEGINDYINLNDNCVNFDAYNLRYKGLSCQLRIQFPETK
jgi:type II secretory pathway pseudopilin PulG